MSVIRQGPAPVPERDYRFVGAIECPRCEIWQPAFEDAIEWDDDGRILAWSGVATADCGDCELSLIDFWDGTMALEWPKEGAA